MTTCARCGRCSRRRRGRFSARSIGRARSASSISGSRARRSRSGTARRAAAGSWSRAWATRAPAPARWSSPSETEDLLAGIAGCLWALGALPQTLVWDRQAGIHAGGGRPTDAFAAFCGQLKVGWHFCEPADPQAKGAVERLQGYRGAQLRAGPACSPTSSTSSTSSTRWFARANARTHKTLRARPIDRLPTSASSWRRCRTQMPDTARRWVTARPARPLPALRHQRLLARPARWSAGASRSASTSARSSRSRSTPASSPAATRASFANHRTITALEHARALQGRAAATPAEPAVEVRSLARYDALIA